MKNTVKLFVGRLLITFTLCAIFFALAASLVMGYLPTAKTHPISWPRGWKELFAIFGGAGSFFTFAGILLMGGAALWLLFRGHLTNYDGRRRAMWGNLIATAIFGIFAMVLIYGGFFKHWMHLPPQAGVVILLLVTIGGVFSLCLSGALALSTVLHERRVNRD